MRTYLAEAIGTFALVFIGIAAIHNAGDSLLTVAFAHGLAIAVMVSATMSISGGHLNPAVTFGAWVGGKISSVETVKYWVAQCLGATLAGLLAYALFGQGVVILGTPSLQKSITCFPGAVIEAVATFFLVFVVYGTGIDPKGPKIGGLAIGLTITMGIIAAGPLTGGALNPARVFGPVLANLLGSMDFSQIGKEMFKEQLVYWIGPLAGGGLAGCIYGRFLMKG